MYVLRATGAVPHEGAPPAKDEELVDADFEVGAVPPGLLQAARASTLPKSTVAVKVVR
jgi:hypothetical protein